MQGAGRFVFAAALVLPLLGLAESPAPVALDGEFADPFVLRDGRAYYAFATSARGAHVQVARSFDLAKWTPLPDALPELPTWAGRDASLTWAPAVLQRGGRWVLYYTARHEASGFQCISRATSARPAGPYVDDTSKPFVCQLALCGSIDPSPFVDASARPWLLWKSDENSAACAGKSRIWSQPLAADGLALAGEPTPLLTTDRAWEEPLIEGPSMVRRGGRTYLLYSAGWYESAQYSVGWASCDGPAGPCKKMTLDGPLMKSSTTLLGPGGQELFDDADGRTWMAYHAWTAPNATYAAGGARSLRFARVDLTSGVPVVTPEKL